MFHHAETINYTFEKGVIDSFYVFYITLIYGGKTKLFHNHVFSIKYLISRGVEVVYT